jgi:hypothetical protein
VKALRWYGVNHDEADPEGDEDVRRPRTAPMPRGRARGWKKWLRIPFAVLFIAGGAAGLASAYREVAEGRGGELQRSLWGYNVSPIGVLVGAGVGLFALAAISLVGWLRDRRDRRWESTHRHK